MAEPAAEQGWVARELAEEFPDLGLRYLTLEARRGRSPESVRGRLQELAERFTGGHVIHMRQDAVPWAYRVFWRQVGIDPDAVPTPVEGMALERLRHGGLPARNLLDDALTIATLETGVAMAAFDAGCVHGAIGLRLSAPGERLGDQGRALVDRQIVIADEERPLAVLGGEGAEDRGATRATTRIAIAAIHVKGVPHLAVEEALWTVAGVLSAGS